MIQQQRQFLRKFSFPKTFNKYSYAVLRLYAILFSIFLIFIGKRHSDEMGTFTCAYVDIKEKDSIRTDCLSQYRDQYDLIVPIYAIAIPHLILAIIISLFYSMYATIRMKELHFVEKAKLDACYQQRRKSSRLFNAYLTEMMAQIFVGFIFSVLEKVYFSQHIDFPLKYDCEYRSTSLSRPVQLLNSNVFVTNVSIAASPETERYSCTYQKDGVKSLFIRFFYTLNVTFLFTLTSEILFIYYCARREKHFKEDKENEANETK